MAVAEKTLRSMRKVADSHPEIRFVAVSHSNESSTSKWLDSIDGPGSVGMVVDPERHIFASWGLGTSSLWHVLSPSSLQGVYKLGREEGIWNRPTESGSRWQTAGSFACDSDGTVVWVKIASAANDIPDFMDAVQTIQNKSTSKS